jgi:hypothetical protein
MIRTMDSDSNAAEQQTQQQTQHACAVCGRVLDRFDSGDGHIGYSHAEFDEAAADHAAIAVPVDELHPLYRCDFCLVDSLEPWTVPARTFAVTPGNRSEGNWAACEICARIILRGDWNKLARRCVDAVIAHSDEHETLDKDMAFQATKMMHRMLRKNMTGAPRPVA